MPVRENRHSRVRPASHRSVRNGRHRQPDAPRRRLLLVVALISLTAAVVGSGASAWSQSSRGAREAVQLNCAASPHVCGFLDATNTGVQPGVTLAASRSIAATRNNQVVQNVPIRNGTTDVEASNVVIRNVKIVIDPPSCGRSSCGPAPRRRSSTPTSASLLTTRSFRWYSGPRRVRAPAAARGRVVSRTRPLPRRGRAAG